MILHQIQIKQINIRFFTNNIRFYIRKIIYRFLISQKFNTNIFEAKIELLLNPQTPLRDNNKKTLQLLSQILQLCIKLLNIVSIKFNFLIFTSFIFSLIFIQTDMKQQVRRAIEKFNALSILNNYFFYNNLSYYQKSIINQQKSYLSSLIRFIQKSHYQSRFSARVYNNMSRAAETSQFYGVEVSDYNIKPLRSKELLERDHNSVNTDNAHIYAFAYQQGYQVPSQSRIVKTVKKNTSGAEITVHRLDRMSRKCTYNPYQYIFKKQKKIVPKIKTKQSIKKQVFQVFSPEQIVIKCARQAYVRQILEKERKCIKEEVKVLSEQEIKRRQHQKQRRLQRALILKAYKYQLFSIFGQIIYRRGWKISREQLKESLKLSPESYAIELMKGILRRRQSKAILDRQLFLLKKKNYQKEKHQRFKMIKLIRRYERRTYVPHSQIKYPHKEEQIYNQKIMHQEKSKQSKVEGEISKKLRKKKMKKQKIWYRQRDNPNSKQIKKQVDESAIQLSEAEEDEFEEIEEVNQLVIGQNGQKDLQTTEQ